MRLLKGGSGMKKIVFGLLVFMFFVPLCLAQDMEITPLYQKITSETKVFVGEIVSETVIIDPEQGSREEIAVKSPQGNEMKFVLWPPIIIQDDDVDPTIHTAEKGDKVFVLYNVTSEGRNDAEFIHTIDRLK